MFQAFFDLLHSFCLCVLLPPSLLRLHDITVQSLRLTVFSCKQSSALPSLHSLFLFLLSSCSHTSPLSLFLPSVFPPPFYLLLFLLLLQLQKAIEGSTRSGVRLRPPLASFRDISNHNSVKKPPTSSPSPSPTSTSSAPTAPQPPSPSPPHHHHLCQKNETEVWIEGVKTEVEEGSSAGSSGGCSRSTGDCTSTSRSCSYNSNLTLPPSSTPPPVPSSSTPPPSPSSSIRLSTLRAPQGLCEGDEDSDDSI